MMVGIGGSIPNYEISSLLDRNLALTYQRSISVNPLKKTKKKKCDHKALRDILEVVHAILYGSLD